MKMVKTSESKLLGKEFCKSFGWFSWIKQIRIEFSAIMPDDIKWEIDIKSFEIIILIISIRTAVGWFKIAIH